MFARTVVNLTISLMLIAPLSSKAQEIDMTSLKCREFVNSKQETATNIMLWLSGYFTYEDDAQIINISKIKNKENQLKQYCADNQDLHWLVLPNVPNRLTTFVCSGLQGIEWAILRGHSGGSMQVSTLRRRYSSSRSP
jgi:acid stress chaperone HdeB